MVNIQIKNAWLMYKIPFSQAGRIVWDNFWGLKDICLEIKQGEILGVIGENGSGKTTLLKLIAGLLKPDRGSISANGRICGLLELGAGFEPELTGRENIELNARLFGLNKQQIDAVFNDIVEFAEIGRFINAPVKYYSQGMFVRLAFAAAIHMQPEVLLIDDSLAVGDKYFQKKCIQRIFELKEQGMTIIFVCHDMSLLQRLCNRAILLKQGMIVKDDSADKVIEFYTQTQGAPQGVGVIKRQELGIIFNNGRLLLNWQDKLLTPGSGIYASFRRNNKWYNSLQAAWIVDQPQSNKLIAKGEFLNQGLEQVWTMEINEQMELKLQIEINSMAAGCFEIEEATLNFLLSNDYTQWLTCQESGCFPVIGKADNFWQAMLGLNLSRRSIGVYANAESCLPGLIVETEKNAVGIYAQIFNTDFPTHSRALQFKTFRLENFSLEKANRCELFNGRIFLNISDIEGYKQSLRDEYTLDAGNLKVQINNGQCALLWQEVLLTKANHIHCLLYANGQWYSSHLARWQVKKQADNSLKAEVSWPNLPLVQQWTLRQSADNAFSWEIDLLVEQEVMIVQQHVYIMLSEQYDSWSSDYGKGLFPAEFSDSEIDILQRCIPQGNISVWSDPGLLPEFSVLIAGGLMNFAKIFNSDALSRARVLRLDKIQPETSIKFIPGQYNSFKASFFCTENQSQNKKKSSQNSKLEKANLKLKFDNGRARIFWHDQELTKQLGLYSSLCVQGRWHDSHSKAVWDVQAQTDAQVVAGGRWLYLPISQIWSIALAANNTIVLNLKMQVHEKLAVDCVQVNIMLSEQYVQWQNSQSQQAFPQFNPEVDDYWQLVSPEQVTEYVAASSPRVDLPLVQLFAHQDKPANNLRILNTDIYHRARLLQHKAQIPQSLDLGEYLIYQGKIVIAGKE